MNKKILILCGALILLILIIGCTEPLLDECDLDEDGTVSEKEQDQCEQTNLVNVCGDEICSEKEEDKGTCPADCDDNSTSNPTPVGSLGDYEDSPFGYHSAGSENIYPYVDAQYIGVKWTRGTESGPPNFWGLVQSEEGSTEFHFKNIDDPKAGTYVNADESLTLVPSNMKILLTISVNGGYLKDNSWEPKNEDEYKAYVRALIERYDGDDDYGCVVSAPDCYADDDEYPTQETINYLQINPVKYWQVENEVFQDRKMSGFAELQRMSYEAIKEVDPEAKVIAGSVVASVEDYISNGDYGFDASYLPILQDLNGQYFDIFDFHWFGFGGGDYRLKERNTNEDVLDHIRDSLEQTGFSRNTPIWVTETGSPSGYVYDIEEGLSSNQTELQQASDYVKIYVNMLSRGIDKIFPVLGLSEIIWFDSDHYFSRTGIIYNGEGQDDLGFGVKKLAYYSYKLMTSKLEGSDWDNVQEIHSNDNVYAYKFMKDNEPIYVVWWDYFEEPTLTSKTISLNDLGISGSVTITDAVPHFENGLLLQNSEEVYPNFFDIETSSTTITLGQSPIYIE